MLWPLPPGEDSCPDSEALMRSRYTAYLMGNAQYIYRTWHEKTRPSLKSLRDSEPQKLVSLKILSTQAGGIDDDKGMVEFVASYENPAVDSKDGVNASEEPIQQHKEKSLFVKVKGRWLYIDAI